MGRAVETRTPGPDSAHDIVTFTVYDDANRAQFQSVPFRVASDSRWIDPNGATDDSGVTPGGTTTNTDPLGRAIGIKDPLLGSAVEPGISCATLIMPTRIWTNSGKGHSMEVEHNNNIFTVITITLIN